MEIEKATRIRSDNWSNEEKYLLYECVRERKEVIESKTNDVKVLKNKRLAWAEIERIFESNGFGRNITKMKDQWKRMKCSAKKNVSFYNRERKKTGGGSPPQKPNELDYLIKDLCPDDFVVDSSTYDSDNLLNKQNSTANPENNDLLFLDPVTGLICDISETETQTLSNPAASTSQPQVIQIIEEQEESRSTNQRKVKKAKISSYEEELLKLETKKFEAEMEFKKEIHKETMNLFELERKTKEEELEAARLKRKREELEYYILEKKINAD